ncbi:MAG: hypothetical protein ABIF19_16070, partial [Planctomycetota bacterium]
EYDSRCEEMIEVLVVARKSSGICRATSTIRAEQLQTPGTPRNTPQNEKRRVCRGLSRDL